MPAGTVSFWSRSNQFNEIKSPPRSKPGVQRPITQVGLNQLFGYSLGLAHSSYSRMIKRPLFGLSGLSSLSGFWLGETYQMNQINQTDRASRRATFSASC
jgi:hypothetical protein